MTSKPKVLLIGLDGVTWDLVQPWAQAGHLPTLKRLMSEGTWGPLMSTLQPVTAPAWVSFMTGVNQGKHGIYDFVRRRAGTYDLEITNASMIGCRTLFDVLSDHGRRVAAINVPFTFPPWRVNGIMVGGLFAPAANPRIAVPADAYDSIRAVAPDYVVQPDYDSRANDPLADFLYRLLASVSARQQVARHFMGTERWDLFAVVFTATDQVQHAFWAAMTGADPALSRFQDAIPQVYRRVDAAVADLLAAADDQTLVIIMSDHGAGPLEKLVQLNRWLSDHRWLRFRNGAGERRGEALSSRFIRIAMTRYRRSVPSTLRARVRMGLGRVFEPLKGRLETQLYASAVDWPATRAYSLGTGGNICINLKGREPAGIVRPGAEYERVRDEIIAGLEALCSPDTNTPIVERVYRREELYHGPYLDLAPDLVVKWRDYSFWGRGRYEIAGTPLFDDISTWEFSDLPLSAVHRLEGVLIVHGSGVRVGQRIEGARLIDLGPTILHVLDLEAPPHMDGRVITGLFAGDGPARVSPASVDSEPARRDADYAYSDEEAEAIQKRLEDLGYL
ncbi:MAG: alkaline phosphatase family protein [Anaerolineae bacterium]